ncbi:unnamed protein product, partial [Allacma fusca]
MDLESLKDRRNRFQVNRVDSVAAGHHCSQNGSGVNGTSNATLVGFKEFAQGDRNDGAGAEYIYTSPMGKEEPERKSSMSDRKGKKVSTSRNTTSFDIPEGPDVEGGSDCDSPARLISTHNAMEHSGGNTVTNAGHPYSHTNSTTYDTKYAKSFRHFTREALPRMDNYRNMMSIQAAYRPTLDELHDMSLDGK